MMIVSNVVRFKDIEQGSVFELDGNLYLKIEGIAANPLPTRIYTAVGLNDGFATEVNQSALVRPVKGKFVEE